MTTTHSPVPARPSLRRSKHERGILAAIGDGATIDDLLACPKWTVNDVAHTLQRYGLVATDDGRLVRKRTIDDLLHLAEHSVSPHVKTAAKQAAHRLERLREAIEAEHTQLLADTDRAHQRDAVEHWIGWLTEALSDARVEKRRLRPRPAAKGV